MKKVVSYGCIMLFVGQLFISTAAFAADQTTTLPNIEPSTNPINTTTKDIETDTQKGTNIQPSTPPPEKPTVVAPVKPVEKEKIPAPKKTVSTPPKVVKPIPKATKTTYKPVYIPKTKVEIPKPVAPKKTIENVKKLKGIAFTAPAKKETSPLINMLSWKYESFLIIFVLAYFSIFLRVFKNDFHRMIGVLRDKFRILMPKKGEINA